jgi:hypothetical protein
MPGTFTVKARLGTRVEKSRHTSLDEALDAIAARIGGVDRRGTARAMTREYEPSRQVAGRFEIAGPGGARGGLDVRGDGSAEAYLGLIRKRLVEQREGESALDALRRALT